MKNKTICKILVFSIVFVIVASGISVGTNTRASDSNISLSSSTINVPGDHKKIQWAIDNATAGDVIIVNIGIYHESVTVNKQLTLKGMGMPVVDAGGRGKAIGIYADGVTLEGFKATNSSGDGISVNSHNNNNITGNIASDNELRGIELHSSSNSSITDNIATNNGWGGIELYSSSNNIITNNTVSNNGMGGIEFWDSSNNSITCNTATNNEDGIMFVISSNNTITNNIANNNMMTGISFLLGGTDHEGSCNNNTITNNIANNNQHSGIDLYSSSNNIITSNDVSNSGWGGITLFDPCNNNTITNNIANNNVWGIGNIATNHEGSCNNTVTGNTASNNSEDGIHLYDSSNSVITGNTAQNNNDTGIYVGDLSNSVITDNTAQNNNDTGIVLYNSSNNTIYNNYFNNTRNAYDNGNNTWNTMKTHGTNIVGGPYLGGNYWSDYNGVDLDGDKLGDTLLPYNCSGGIQNGGDYHPLIEIKVKGHKFNDTNGDGVWDRINESGLANWTIRLEGTAEDGSIISLNTTTDGNGYYRFANVPKGTYTLSEVLADGWIQTWPLAPGTYMVHVTNGCVEDKDFGNRRFWVSGYKFNDINGDGKWDLVNESALANWTIRLEGTAEDGSTVSLTTTTDGNGSYRFEDVPKGTYTLSEISKIGWIRTCPPAPGTYIINITDDDVKDKNFGNRRFHYDGNIIVGAPYEDVRGSTDQGQVYRFYGLTGELRHTIDCPSNHSNALFGYSVSSGMVGSDYRGEIIVGAPGEGRVYTFYGATSKLHHTIGCPSSQPGALFGNSVGAGDVNGDGFDEIIVGAPGEGRVYTFYGLTGKLHHTIDCPSSQPDALFGNSVGAGDLNGDGFDEIIVGAPGEDVGGDESQGRVYTFYGLTGELHHTIDCPNPQPGVLFGHSVNTDDLVSDYREEVIVGAPGEDVGGKKDHGRGYTFYGATSKLHVPLNCTSSQPDALFGHSLSAGDMSGDGLNEVIVGAPGEGRVYTFYGLTGKLRHTIDCPNSQPDASFGYSVSAGTVGSDYRDEVIVGTPGEDVGGNESQGRVYTFYGATSKLRHTLDTPNPQSGANFGYSVCVIGGFMGVTCSDSRVNINHTQTSVTDDPVGEGYDVSNAPAGVNLAYAKGFNIVATGPDGSYPFDVTFSSPIIESSVLHKLPAWTEAPHTRIGPNTIQVQLDIIEGVLDPPFILAPVEGVPLPDLTLTSEDIRFIPTASTSTSSYSSGQTTLTKDIHKPKSAPNIIKNVKSAQPYKEIISIDVMSSSDAPTFTIENLTYPHTVNPNQTFQVTIDTNYSFETTTDIVVGIWDYHAGEYIAETPDNETLFGTGSKSYTFNLTAPPSGIMDLSADACYWDGDYGWICPDYRDFEVTISTQSFTIENLTYPATVNSNQIFQVIMATNYSFSATTDIFAGIWDRDASDYIAGTPKNETLFGTGSRSYTFNLTAPASGTMNISATLWYRGDYGDGILSERRDFNVNVGLEEPDFTITSEPTSQTVSQGDSAPYTISLTSLNGFNSPITLSVSGLPTGTTDIFNPSIVTPSDSSTLTINTSETTPTGNYTLTITGVGGEITHQTTVALNITVTGEGGITTISATIHNIGTTGASNVIVQFFDGNPDAGGIQIGDDQIIASIPVYGDGTVSVDWTPEAYAYAIYVRADPFDSIQESNEGNNIAFNTILLGIRGDLNNDGEIAPTDAMIALRIVAGNHLFDPATLAAADVSGDGQVTSLDALTILQAAAGSTEL